MNIGNNSNILGDVCLVSFIVRSPSSSYIRSTITASVVNIVLAVAGTILNSFVLFIFWKSARLRSKLSSFAIMLLCLIDIGVGTVVNPLFVLKSITMLDSPKCLYIVAYNIVLLFFSGISGCTLLIVNIERYFAIIHPILHRIHFTKGRFVLTWTFFWFFVIVWIGCSVYFPFVAEVIISVTICIVVLTSLFTYVAIYVVARKKMSKRNEVHSNIDQESRRNSMAFLRELKMAKNFVLVVSLCFLCYLPTVVVYGIANNFKRDKLPDSVVHAWDWTATLVSMNSTLNCLIFFWGNRELRKEGSKILKKCFHRQEDQQFELNVVQMRERQGKR